MKDENAAMVDSSEGVGTRKVLKGGMKRSWKAPGDQFSKHLGRFITDNKNGGAWEKRKEERERKQVSRLLYVYFYIISRLLYCHCCFECGLVYINPLSSNVGYSLLNTSSTLSFSIGKWSVTHRLPFLPDHQGD